MVDLDAGIYLRPMKVEDAPDIVRWRNNPEVKKHYIYQGEFTVESHLEWMKKHVDTGEVVQFMICVLETDQAIGCVNVQEIDRTHNKAEYGIFIGEDTLRGKGIGTAAAKLMLKYCFEEAGLHRIYLRALASNKRAIKSYEKAGFTLEGILKDDAFVNGAYQDIAWMAVINPNEK